MPFEKVSSMPHKSTGPFASGIVFLLVIGLLMAQTGFGQEQRKDSPSFLSLGVEGYQKLLSPVLNSKCYMFPSCSEYSIQSISDYGPLLGLMLTIDRLFHEANEDRTSPMVRRGDQLKLYDPPSANIWWK